MPPRRRRKKTDACRPTLEFQESPVHIVHKVVSPVFSADHPLTADVVPLDSDTSIPWVSPQFRGPISPSRLRNRRQRNPSRSQHATRSRNHSMPGGHHTPGKTRAQHLNHYKSLQFVGDRTKNATSPVEELSINTQEEVYHRGNSRCCLATSKENRVTSSSHATSRSSPGSCAPVVLSEGNTREQENTFRGCGNKVKDMFSDDSTASDCDMPKRKIIHTCAKKRKTKPHRVLRKWDGDKNSSVERLLSDSPIPQDVQSASPLCARRSLAGTQQRPRPDIATRTTKRLFSESRVEPQEVAHKECDPDASLVRRRSLRNMGISSTPQRPTGSAPASPLDICTPTLSCYTPRTNTGSPGHPCLEHEDMFAPLLTPTQRCLPSDCKVLVYDTPEEDYGLPVRLRRRRCRLNKSRIT